MRLDKQQNRFAGSFSPTVPGRHHVEVSSLEHPVQDLADFGGKLTKPLFFARAQFLVFSPGRVSEREQEPKEPLELDILPVTRALDPLRGSIVPKAGAEFAVRLVFKGKPLARRRITALGPNGWSKELPATDSWGVTTFVPVWPGRYVLTAVNDEKVPGEFRGQRYEVVAYRASFSLVVGQEE